MEHGPIATMSPPKNLFGDIQLHPLSTSSSWPINHTEQHRVLSPSQVIPADVIKTTEDVNVTSPTKVEVDLPTWTHLDEPIDSESDTDENEAPGAVRKIKDARKPFGLQPGKHGVSTPGDFSLSLLSSNPAVAGIPKKFTTTLNYRHSVHPFFHHQATRPPKTVLPTPSALDLSVDATSAGKKATTPIPNHSSPSLPIVRQKTENSPAFDANTSITLSSPKHARTSTFAGVVISKPRNSSPVKTRQAIELMDGRENRPNDGSKSVHENNGLSSPSLTTSNHVPNTPSSSFVGVVIPKSPSKALPSRTNLVDALSHAFASNRGTVNAKVPTTRQPSFRPELRMKPPPLTPEDIDAYLEKRVASVRTPRVGMHGVYDAEDWDKFLMGEASEWRRRVCLRFVEAGTLKGEHKDENRSGKAAPVHAVPSKSKTDEFLARLDSSFGPGDSRRGSGPIPKAEPKKGYARKPNALAREDSYPDSQEQDNSDIGIQSGIWGQRLNNELSTVSNNGTKHWHPGGWLRQPSEPEACEGISTESILGKRSRKVESNEVDAAKDATYHGFSVALDWVRTLQKLIKGKTTINSEGLHEIRTVLHEIYEARDDIDESVKKKTKLFESVLQLSELKEIPFDDKENLRGLAKGLIEFWRSDLPHT